MDFAAIIQILSPGLLGATIGYLTNTIAIKMLFKPHTEWRIYRIKVPFTPGLIPKHRAEIAQNIATLVSEVLLNKETLHKQILNPQNKTLVESHIHKSLHKIFTREHPTIHELLPQNIRNSALKAYKKIRKSILRKSIQWFQDTGPVIIEETIENLTKSHRKNPIQGFIEAILDPKTLNYRGIFEFFSQGDALRNPLTQLIKELQHSTARPKDYIPAKVLEIFIKKITDRVPEFLDKLREEIHNSTLSTDIHRQIAETLYQYLDRLNPIQKIIATAWGIEERIERDLPPLITENIDEIFTELQEEDKQKIFHKTITETIDSVLERPISEFCTQIQDPNILQDVLNKPLTQALSNPKIQNIIFEGFQETLKKLSLGKIFPKANQATQFSKHIQQILTQSLSKRTYKRILNAIDAQILHTKIGTIASHIPDINTLHTLCSRYFTERLFRYLDHEIDSILTLLDTHKTIHTKITQFPIKDIEKMILLIIKKHLKWINIFGAIIGAIIGSMQYFF